MSAGFLPPALVSFFTSDVLGVLIGLGVLSFLVLIHELGHFVVARRAGVHVEVFSIGFGPRLFGLKVGETEYRVCAVLFGGYVAMRGDASSALEGKPKDAGEAANELDRRWNQETAPLKGYEDVSIGWRAAIAAAGPTVNIAFALLALWVVAMVGMNVEVKGSMVLSHVDSTGPAFKAGIRPGDTVVSFNGRALSGASRFAEDVATSLDQDVRIAVLRGGKDSVFTFRPTQAPIKATRIGWAGMEFGGRLLLARVLDSTPASRAGIRQDDTLLSVDGRQPAGAEDFIQTVQGSEGRKMRFAIARKEGRTMLEIAALKSEKDGRWRIGVAPMDVVPTYFHRAGPVEAVGIAFSGALDKSTAVFRILGKLLARKVDAQNLSGPVGIIRASGAIARLGWEKLIDWMVLLSINLGILNFLPLVITDGGRLVELAIEKFRGRKADRVIMEKISMVVVGLFLMLALYVTYFDIQRWSLFK
ncbi:MAG: RIP metalloprotease RseP [Fibrobacterota bacterium]|nr:MAG: RIP metalloprotease RseP [Fibrobacterota bacterium]